MNVFLVDDERLARQELRRLLGEFPALNVVGEARNVDEAVEAMKSLELDLLFLDIRMPGGSGFDLLERLDRVPQVIFTTAYDKYAVKAFQVNALDYLLKPVEPERLAAAVEKVLARAGEHARAAAGRSEHLGAEDRVFVRDGDRCWLVRLGDVALFESEGNYTRLHFGDSRPLVHRSLRNLDERLDPRAFFRANRRQTLNLKQVSRMEPSSRGGLVVVLEDGLEVEMSRRQAQRFRSLMSL